MLITVKEVYPVTNPRCADWPTAGLLEGIDLFNQRLFFECHEVLEDLWRAERDPIRTLYQGILQIGVGYYHLGNMNWRGATALLGRGIEKVARFTPRCMGVETGELVRESQTCLDLVRRLGPARVAEFDWSLVPTITVHHQPQPLEANEPPGPYDHLKR
jgi:predicted metal-dependent hydrolase